jgi:hypothetical protein
MKKYSIILLLFLSSSILLLLACSDGNTRDCWWLSPELVPAWAETGKFHTARWDGGPIEAEKGKLSGWPHWQEGDPEQVLKAVSSFYGKETVKWAKRAGLNWLWVTWSVGFSHETEQKQWDILQSYIRECHKNGIKVTAYMSGANIFHEDVAKHLPQSTEWYALDKEGNPIPYGAAKYNRYGITRYMADTQHPDWLPYQRVRIRKALEAGVDGFWIDNIGSRKHKRSIYELIDIIFAESKSFDNVPLVCFNMHRGALTLARYTNCLSTEDGYEPGYYPHSKNHNEFPSQFDAMEDKIEMPESDLVCNIAILKYQYAVSEGWRPSSVEYGKRHNGVSRMVDVMAPEKWQLSLAECQMFHNSLEPYFEGIFMRDLVAGDDYAHSCIDAMGTYNHFFSKYSHFYTNPHSLAPVAAIAPYDGGKTERELITWLNQLSRFDIQYDVVFNKELSAAVLKKYRIAILPANVYLSPSVKSAVRDWLEAGGELYAFGDRKDREKTFECRLDSSATGIEKGIIRYYENNPTAIKMATTLENALQSSMRYRIEAPPYVLHNAVSQQDSGRTIIHLLNYSQKPVADIRIVVNRATLQNARMYSPDFKTPQPLTAEIINKKTVCRIPLVKTYSVVVL